MNETLSSTTGALATIDLRRIRVRPRAAVLGSIVLAALLGAGAPALAETLNRIVLRVNDQIATLYDYELRRSEAIRDLTRRARQGGEKPEMAQIGEMVFRNMFEELLLNSRADQLSIEVSEQQITAAEAQMRENFGIKTDQEFAQALAESGMTEPQLREQLRRTLREREVMGKEMANRVKAKEEDLRRYYRANSDKFRVPEQVQLREVVVLDDGTLAPEARARAAEEIRKAVAAGKSLADAVASYAEKGATSKVVDFGWVSPGDLDKALETAAWTLPKGAVSEPVKARGGLHLLQVMDRRPAHVQPFSEVQAAIQQHEQERLYQEESVKYLAELEQRALVVANPPPEAANFRRNAVRTESDPLKSLPPAEGAAAAKPGAAKQGAPAGEAEAVEALEKEVTPGKPAVAKPSTLPAAKPVDPSPSSAPTPANPSPPPPPPASGSGQAPPGR